MNLKSIAAGLGSEEVIDEGSGTALCPSDVLRNLLLEQLQHPQSKIPATWSVSCWSITT